MHNTLTGHFVMYNSSLKNKSYQPLTPSAVMPADTFKTRSRHVQAEKSDLMTLNVM